MPEWFYVGHYGQLGPLTLEQMGELIEGGVVTRETYVWKSGMSDWVPAERAQELEDGFQAANPYASPPPVPSANSPKPFSRTLETTIPPALPAYADLRSDKNRVTAGILNLIPGAGRFYLGYSTIGTLQIIAVLACGIGLIWSWVDGVLILSGSIKLDGRGRRLSG